MVLFTLKKWIPVDWIQVFELPTSPNLLILEQQSNVKTNCHFSNLQMHF